MGLSAHMKNNGIDHQFFKIDDFLVGMVEMYFCLIKETILPSNIMKFNEFINKYLKMDLFSSSYNREINYVAERHNIAKKYTDSNTKIQSELSVLASESFKSHKHPDYTASISSNMTWSGVLSNWFGLTSINKIPYQYCRYILKKTDALEKWYRSSVVDIFTKLNISIKENLLTKELSFQNVFKKYDVFLKLKELDASLKGNKHTILEQLEDYIDREVLEKLDKLNSFINKDEYKKTDEPMDKAGLKQLNKSIDKEILDVLDEVNKSIQSTLKRIKSCKKKFYIGLGISSPFKLISSILSPIDSLTFAYGRLTNYGMPKNYEDAIKLLQARNHQEENNSQKPVMKSSSYSRATRELGKMGQSDLTEQLHSVSDSSLRLMTREKSINNDSTTLTSMVNENLIHEPTEQSCSSIASSAVSCC